MTEPVRALPASERGRLRRAQILGALGHLLEERSLSSIEVDDVTSAVGLGRSAFYFYFPTLGDAVAALMEQTFQLLIDSASAWHERYDLTPNERVQISMANTVETWRGNARMLAAILEAAASAGDAASLWQATQASLEARACERIQIDQQRGLIEPDVPAQSAAEILIGMTAAAMQRDVMSIVATGKPRPAVAEMLSRAWTLALYSDVGSGSHC